MPINYEFKAKSTQNDAYEAILKNHQADFKGIDTQIDTYFQVPNGRMKLREGNIENYLIHYVRSNDASAKLSEVLLYKSQPESELKAILTKALGVKVVVKKERKIFFIQNVKFHLDEVEGLGTFVEIEAIDTDGTHTIHDLQRQCTHFQALLGIETQNMVAISYSDMMM
jgi:adenylate cyclase, class 2